MSRYYSYNRYRRRSPLGRMSPGRLVRRVGFVVVLLALYVFIFVAPAPKEFPANDFVEITQGSGLSQISDVLQEQHAISSASWFKTLLYLIGRQDDIKSGTYYFTGEKNMFSIMSIVLRGDFNLPTETITIFEGEAVYKFADRLAKDLPNVEAEVFADLVAEQQKEGFLYPDTYSFPLDVDEQDIVDIMEKNFRNKIAEVQSEVDLSGYSLKEIVTMASLVEGEAGSASYATKQKVAGILWKRIELGMPIQADAVFSYIKQEHLPRVLFSHLEIDSPYNIYKNLGLPPGPIGNPSISSIKATLNPQDSNYIFYITGNDGNFYYATTLGGHNQNIRTYLR